MPPTTMLSLGVTSAQNTRCSTTPATSVPVSTLRAPSDDSLRCRNCVFKSQTRATTPTLPLTYLASKELEKRGIGSLSLGGRAAGRRLQRISQNTSCGLLSVRPGLPVPRHSSFRTAICDAHTWTWAEHVQSFAARTYLYSAAPSKRTVSGVAARPRCTDPEQISLLVIGTSTHGAAPGYRAALSPLNATSEPERSSSSASRAPRPLSLVGRRLAVLSTTFGSSPYQRAVVQRNGSETKAEAGSDGIGITVLDFFPGFSRALFPQDDSRILRFGVILDPRQYHPWLCTSDPSTPRCTPGVASVQQATYFERPARRQRRSCAESSITTQQLLQVHDMRPLLPRSAFAVTGEQIGSFGLGLRPRRGRGAANVVAHGTPQDDASLPRRPLLSHTFLKTHSASLRKPWRLSKSITPPRNGRSSLEQSDIQHAQISDSGRSLAISVSALVVSDVVPITDLRPSSFPSRPLVSSVARLPVCGCLTGVTSSRVRRGRYIIATAKSTNISFVTSASRRCLRDRKSRSQEACGDNIGSVWHPSVERSRYLRSSLPSSSYIVPISPRNPFTAPPPWSSSVRTYSLPALRGPRIFPFDDESFQALVPRFLRAVLPSTSYTLPASIHGIPSRLRRRYSAPLLAPRSSLSPPSFDAHLLLAFFQMQKLRLYTVVM
ncbi:hypothetical protein B0H13DRAFT_2347652 [Mycena leptocephala]|nr:hypothetical protein B0H13DRAFT_2347652 [Mycena leptocephala]